MGCWLKAVMTTLGVLGFLGLLWFLVIAGLIFKILFKILVPLLGVAAVIYAVYAILEFKDGRRR